MSCVIVPVLVTIQRRAGLCSHATSADMLRCMNTKVTLSRKNPIEKSGPHLVCATRTLYSNTTPLYVHRELSYPTPGSKIKKRTGRHQIPRNFKPCFHRGAELQQSYPMRSDVEKVKTPAFICKSSVSGTQERIDCASTSSN